MSAEKTQSHLLKRIILHSVRWPAVYLIIGIILTALSYIDMIFPLTQWKNLFDLTDKVGNIFIALALVTFIYNLFIFLCLHFEKNTSQSNKIASLIMSSVRKGSRIIFILVTINIIISIVGPSRSYVIFANNIIDTILIGSVGWIAIQILDTIEAVLFHNMSSLTQREHVRVQALYTKMHIIRNIGTVVIIIITGAAILMSFSSVRNIGISLLASAGFLSAIIGLSAQKTLVSLFSGLQIAISQPIKIGDIVVVEKDSGIVEEITFTHVTLKLGDRRRLIVPISYFIEKPFENWSNDGISLTSSLYFYIDYMMPLEPLRDILDNILEKSSYWDGTAKKLQVSNLTDRSVEIRVQLSAANGDNLSDLCAEVREKLLEFIREHYADHFPKVRFNSGPNAE
jgi:small-conductance mechanosensitive channel